MCIPQTVPGRCQQTSSSQQNSLTVSRVAATNAAYTIARRPNFNEPVASFNTIFVTGDGGVEDRDEFFGTNAADRWQTPPVRRRRGAALSPPVYNSNSFEMHDSDLVRHHRRRGLQLTNSWPADKEYADLRLCRQLKTWIVERLPKILSASHLNQYFFRHLFTTSDECAEQTSHNPSTTTTRFGSQHSIANWRQSQTNSDGDSIMTVRHQSEEPNVLRQLIGATGDGRNQRLHSEISELTQSERSARLQLLTKSLKWARSLAFILLISNAIVLFKILDYRAVGLPNLHTSLRVSPASPLKTEARDGTLEEHQQQRQQQQGRRGQRDLMMSEETGLAAQKTEEATVVAATSRWQKAYDEALKHYDDSLPSAMRYQPELMSTDRREQAEREHLQEHDHAKHFGLLGADIYYYLLIVALLDLFSHLNWYHSRQTYNQSHRQQQQHHSNIRPSGQQQQQQLQQQASSRIAATTTTNALALNSHQAQSVPSSSSSRPSSSSCNWLALVVESSRRSSWLNTSILLVTSSKHLFQFLQVSLFVMLDSRSVGKLVLLMTCLNYLNQTGKFALYLCKILYYLRTISSESATKANYNSNEIQNDRISNYLFDYPSLSGQATFERHVNSWLAAAGHNSNLSKIEKYLMMSRIFQIQLTVIALFAHLDTLPIEYSFEVIVLVCAIAQAFLEMYFQYDKYYCKYWQRSMADETGEDDTDDL